MLAGLQEPDHGQIVSMQGATIGYLPQEGLSYSGRSVFDECLSVLTGLLALEGEQRELAEKLAALQPGSGEYRAAAARYADLRRPGIPSDAGGRRPAELPRLAPSAAAAPVAVPARPYPATNEFSTDDSSRRTNGEFAGARLPWSRSRDRGIHGGSSRSRAPPRLAAKATAAQKALADCRGPGPASQSRGQRFGRDLAGDSVVRSPTGTRRGVAGLSTPPSGEPRR